MPNHLAETSKINPGKFEEIKDDCCKQNEISDWEDEGGANPYVSPSLFSSCGLMGDSFLTVHLKTAEALLEAGDYDSAVDELESAAERFLTYKDNLNASFNNSIAQLTMLGCHATPPHPKAVSLIKLRRQITA